MLHKLTIIGRVGKDAATKYTQGGKVVTEFSVAVEDRKDETTWYNVSVWGQGGERLVGKVRKGAIVSCDGKPNPRPYINKKDDSLCIDNGLDVNDAWAVRIIVWSKDQQAEGGNAFSDWEASEDTAPLPSLSRGD